jgi:phage-related protein
MTTVIEENELNTELQELYLKSKEWISELKFIESDMEFLKSLFGRTFSPLIKDDNFEKIAEVLINVAKAESVQLDLKNDLQQYLHQLETLITDMNPHIELSIVETHTRIECRLKAVSEEYVAIKKVIFDLTKRGLKEVAISRH